MFSKTKPTVLTFGVLLLLAVFLTLPAAAQGGSKGDPKGGGDKGTNTSAQSGEISQWASSASASSEYVGWEATGATGPADINDCGDLRGSWASEKWDDGVEWWLGYYDTPVIPSQINVYQNYNPGTIVNLVVFAVGSDEPIVLENSADTNVVDCPHVFSYQVSGVEVAVDRVGLFVDQAANKSWTEVDAVELIGVASGDPGTGSSKPDSTKPTVTSDTAPGISITCPNGATFDNGVEIIVNMRPGFSYTATAIGVGSFDPIVAVTDGVDTLCNDDNPDVSGFQASLPTTGEIGPSSFSAQMPFTYSGAELGNISFVVGSPDSGAGSFVLMIEGLAVTANDGSGDGAGDPFYITLSENVIASGVDISAYMISVTDALDSLIYVVDSNDEMIFLDDGTAAACDDAGTESCYGGQGDSMRGTFVTRVNGNQLGGGQYDSFMALPSDVFEAGSFLEYRFSSSQQRTRGDYIATFHVGTAAAK